MQSIALQTKAQVTLWVFAAAKWRKCHSHMWLLNTNMPVFKFDL